MTRDTIRRLFALASDQAGTPEGDTAARIARELMLERTVELAKLEAGARNDVDPFVRERILLGGPKHWRCRLVSIVARHCECVAGYSPGSGKASLYGRRSNVEVADYLYVVLSRTLTLERAGYLVELRHLDEGALTRRANDFSQTAIMALDIRLREMRHRERDVEPEAHALVRQANRGFGAWIKRRGHSIKAEPPMGYAYSAEGYKAGYRLPIVDGISGG